MLIAKLTLGVLKETVSQFVLILGAHSRYRPIASSCLLLTNSVFHKSDKRRTTQGTSNAASVFPASATCDEKVYYTFCVYCRTSR